MGGGVVLVSIGLRIGFAKHNYSNNTVNPTEIFCAVNANFAI